MKTKSGSVLQTADVESHLRASSRKDAWLAFFSLKALLLVFSCSLVSDSLPPHGLQHARLPCLLPSPRDCSHSCPLISDVIQPSRPLPSPSPPAFNFPQHQDLFLNLRNGYFHGRGPVVMENPGTFCYYHNNLNSHWKSNELADSENYLLFFNYLPQGICMSVLNIQNATRKVNV